VAGSWLGPWRSVLVGPVTRRGAACSPPGPLRAHERCVAAGARLVVYRGVVRIPKAMAVPYLPAVAELAKSLSQEVLADSSSTLFQVTGRAWTGKSSLLSLLAAELRDDRIVLLADPPSGANDAGPLAIMQVAAGLKYAGELNGATDALRDPGRPLEDKVELVRSWMEQRPVVLLLDEPERWGARSDTTGHFAERARIVSDALIRDLKVTRVFTGTAPPGVRAARRTIPSASHGRAFLDDGAVWGPLAGVAANVADDSAVEEMTPLELRLLVAAQALGATEATASGLSRRDRADELFRFLDSPDGPKRLGDAWRRLATIRSTFPTALLDQFAGGLPDDLNVVLEHCLLLASDDGWVMHENLRADARRHRGPHDDRGLLEELAGYYDSATDELDSVKSHAALLTLMETGYYAATAGRRDIVERRSCFVEQLDLLGKALSLERRDYRGAVEVFEFALKLDAEDDYAAHYIGFNLDRLGADAARAEARYRLAVELNEDHVWWRSRLISFLAERGQLLQARREWDDALDAVIPPNGTSDSSLYETLHGWVVSTLLRIGELGFARTVLNSVPPEVVEESPMLRELAARLRAFEITDRDGAYVPATLLRDGWWKTPSLLQRRVGTNDRLLLRRWLAGRIEAIEDEAVELRVAEVKLDRQPPRYARARIAIADFDAWTRDESASELASGRFVEIGLYSAEDGTEPTRILRVHPEELVGADAPGSVGPLDRWHRELAGTLS
jgi:tetratricopeptide (TPR) repeat protein